RDGREIAAADARERPPIDLRLSGATRSGHDRLPVLAGIRGPVEADDARSGACAATAGVRHVTGRDRIEHARGTRRDGDVCLDDARQPFRQWFPGPAAIGRLEDAVSCAAKALSLEEALLLLPERCIDDVRVRRVDADVVAARVLVFVKHLLEGVAAVAG